MLANWSYRCETCGVDSNAWTHGVRDFADEPVRFLDQHIGHALTILANGCAMPIPPPAASAATSDDPRPTWLIFTNTPLPLDATADIARAIDRLGGVVVPGDVRIERVPPPAVFAIIRYTVQGDVFPRQDRDLVAIFGTQAEADAWVATQDCYDHDVERWELGPPQKERTDG